MGICPKTGGHLAKAFDSVPHEHLLIKLRSLGIVGNLINWLRHFLTCRKQRVVVRGTFSEWAPVVSGTPQGTILGPILFVSYINDIADCVSSNCMRMTLRSIENSEIRLLTYKHFNLILRASATGRIHGNYVSMRKSEAMRITHSCEKSSTDYTLGSVSESF